jgi:hypothetical protein
MQLFDGITSGGTRKRSGTGAGAGLITEGVSGSDGAAGAASSDAHGGFSFWVAVSFTVNYIMGCGFLGIPNTFVASVRRAGIADEWETAPQSWGRWAPATWLIHAIRRELTDAQPHLTSRWLRVICRDSVYLFNRPDVFAFQLTPSFSPPPSLIPSL